MRPIAFAMLTAFAATGAAAASSDFLLTLPPGKGELAGKGQQIEIQSFHWGPRQSTSTDGSRGRAGNQVIMDDTAGREKLQPGGASGGGGAAQTVGANETLTVGGAQTEAAQATGKRQHKAITITKEWDARSAPLPQGSVRVKVRMPWLACRVGASYPRLELAGGGKTYVLEDVTVASCRASGDADDRPTEEVAFYYNRIL